MYALAASLDNLSPGADPLPVLAAHLDLERYLRFAAAELLLGHWDGYAWSANNYLIHHGGPDDGWTFIPWGIDQLFEDPLGPYAGVMRHPGPAWVPGPGGRVHELCFASAECRRRLADAISYIVAVSKRIDLSGLARSARRLVEPYVLAEAQAYGDPALTIRALDQIEAYLADHSAAMESWQPCLVGQSVDHDGDGADGCTSDCDDREADVYPGAPERCNLRDDDCNGLIDDPPGCPKCIDAVLAGTSRFRLCFEPRSWLAAEGLCASHGGHLVSIHDPAGDGDLRRSFRARLTIGSFWIGLNDRQREAAFAWSDGSAVDFVRWAPAAPRPDGESLDCVVLQEHGWQDARCEEEHAFACRLP